MTKNSKAMRRVLCGVVSFLLSFFSCLFVMCLVFKFTVLSPSFLVGVEKRSDYAEALHSELKEQFVSYGSAGNVDESFFDSVFENIITMTVELGSWTRKKSLLVNLVLIFVLSLPAILGFNLLSGFQPFGDGSSVMDLEDFLVSYNILPLGSLIYVLFCVRKNGWGWEKFLAEVNEGTGTKLPAWLRGYMAYVVPTLICLIYLKGYYDMFAGKGTGVLLGWMAFAVLLLAVIFWVCFSTGKKPAVKAETEIE